MIGDVFLILFFLYVYIEECFGEVTKENFHKTKEEQKINLNISKLFDEDGKCFQ